MALQSFANKYGTVISPFYQLPLGTTSLGVLNSATLDAAGESLAAVGHVLFSTGPGTSKTISSSGGKIYWKPGTVTFSNAATRLRVGIQDVGATGLEDGAYDVYDEYIAGTDTITANVVNTATMQSGSKTIAHGDLIAVVIEMTARGGGADSVVVARGSTFGTIPYCTVDSGAGPAIVNGFPVVTIGFDDGTIGWFTTANFAQLSEASPAMNTGTTPDEAALIFRLAFPAQVAGLLLELGSLAATDDFEGVLYSDPLGTPFAEATLTQDMSQAGLGGSWERPLASALSLSANTDYAVAVRPTTANSLTYLRINFNTGNGDLRKATMLGTNWSLGTRSDQTGAFTPDTTILPLFGVWLSAFDDGASAGGTTIAGTPMLRGMVA